MYICMYICIYIHAYIHTYIHTYIHIYYVYRGRDEGRALALPGIRGLDMSIVSKEAPTLALSEEENYQSAEQLRLSRLAKMLP